MSINKTVSKWLVLKLREVRSGNDDFRFVESDILESNFIEERERYRAPLHRQILEQVIMGDVIKVVFMTDEDSLKEFEENNQKYTSLDSRGILYFKLDENGRWERLESGQLTN